MNIKSFFSNIAIVAVLMGVFLFVKCSGGGSGSSGDGIEGTWVDCEDETVLEFSGKKYKVSYDFGVQIEGTYELKEEYKEKGFSRGTIVLKGREVTKELDYTLDGNELIFNGDKFIKGKKERCGKGSSSSGVSLAKDACDCMKKEGEAFEKCANEIMRKIDRLSDIEKKKYDDYECR